MNRRQFLQASSSAVLAAELAAYADTPILMGTLGKTGLRVTRITLGGAHMRFGTEENALRIIRRALDLGINFFDTANVYSSGDSEIVLGNFLKASGRREAISLDSSRIR